MPLVPGTGAGVLRRGDLRERGPAGADGKEQLNVFIGARRVQTPASTVSTGRASGSVHRGNALRMAVKWRVLVPGGAGRGPDGARTRPARRAARPDPATSAAAMARNSRMAVSLSAPPHCQAPVLPAQSPPASRRI